MTADELIERIDAASAEFTGAIAPLVDEQAIRATQAQFLGKKGRLSALMRDLAALPPPERPRVGEAMNRVKQAIETDWHTFEALAIPKDPPARDMQDTFYVSDEIVLRPHTSPVQIRTMQAHQPPIRIIAPGQVYRRDDDPTHSPMFTQIEGLAVDVDIKFSDLKGTLEHYVRRFFGKSLAIRFRPSYFPFVEPGAEVDMQCSFCGGSGCRICKHTGWVEIGGAGIVDPEVFAHCKIDPEKYSGFAFGMGLERMAMLRHGVNDIKFYYEGDLRFLEQF